MQQGPLPSVLTHTLLDELVFHKWIKLYIETC